MSFKKGEKVVYPKHGAGKIIELYTERINGDEQPYLKIEFFNSPSKVSIPTARATELGLRYPLSKKELLGALKELNKTRKIDKKMLVTLDVMSKEKMNSGKIEDAIELVSILKSLAKQKEEENKNFSYSYSDRLDVIYEFIKSEIELVLGKTILKKYDLF
jgi:CarD family transcriptional regulator